MGAAAAYMAQKKYERRTDADQRVLVNKYERQWPFYCNVLQGMDHREIQLNADTTNQRVQWELDYLQAVWDGKYTKSCYFIADKMVSGDEAVDAYGRSALHLAVIRGNKPLIRKMLDSNLGTLNVQDYYGWTPLMYACYWCCPTTCIELISANAKVDIEDNYGINALIVASSSPYAFIMEFLTPEQQINSGKDRRKLRKARGSTYKMGLWDKMFNKRKAQQIEHLLNLKLNKSSYPHDTQLNQVGVLQMHAILYTKSGLFGPECLRPGIVVDAHDARKRTALHYAAKYGHILPQGILMEARANIEAKDRDGRTAIHLAVKHFNAKILEHLILNGANINEPDNLYETPLHLAILYQFSAGITTLLNAKANINAIDFRGRTPLFQAVQNGDQVLIEKLLEMGSKLDIVDDQGCAVITLIAKNKMARCLTVIFNKIENYESWKVITRSKDINGFTALHHCVEAGDVDGAKMFLEIDPDTCNKDCNGNTPLHLAAVSGNLSVMGALKDFSSFLDPRNSFGETPLLVAAHKGDMAIVLSLLSIGGLPPADSDAKDNRGRTFLMHAVISGCLTLVNIILQNMEGNHKELGFSKIEFNAVDLEKKTALMHAAQNGHWQLISSLICSKTDVEMCDSDGCTALHFSAIEGESLCCLALIDHYACVDAVDKLGCTPLHYAAEYGEVSSCDALCERRANVGVVNYAGETPLQLAIRNKHYKVSEILCQEIRDMDKLLGLSKHNPRMTRFPARGTFIITVLRGYGLRIAGERHTNPYCHIYFRSSGDVNAETAFTSSVLSQNDEVSWNYSICFKTEAIDASEAQVVISVLRAPMKLENKLGAKTNELTTHRARPWRDRRKEEIDKSYDKELDLQFSSAAKKQEMEAVRSKAAIAAEKLSKQAIEQWESAWKAYKGAADLNSALLLPPVHESHMPYGYTIFGFRQLRQAVWKKTPIFMDVPLKAGVNGRIQFEVEFRPTFWEANIIAKKMQIKRPNTPTKEDINDVHVA